MTRPRRNERRELERVLGLRSHHVRQWVANVAEDPPVEGGSCKMVTGDMMAALLPELSEEARADIEALTLALMAQLKAKREEDRIGPKGALEVIGALIRAGVM